VRVIGRVARANLTMQGQCAIYGGQVTQYCTFGSLVDASEPRLLAGLTELPPRQELAVRMTLNGRSENQGRNWIVVKALMKELKINNTAQMAKRLTEGRNAGT
jgi:hypothetical protein